MRLVCASDLPEFRLQPDIEIGTPSCVRPMSTKRTTSSPSNVGYGNIVKGLPIPRNVSRGIYCSHILEHLSLEDARIALRNTYAHLRPGGVFRLVVPDLEHLARGYLSNNDSDAAIKFMESTCLGKKHRVRSIAGMLSEWVGNSAHLWMWDEKAMKQELSRQGFVKIRRAALGDRRRFDDVEQPDRFVGALAVQCEKDCKEIG